MGHWGGGDAIPQVCGMHANRGTAGGQCQLRPQVRGRLGGAECQVVQGGSVRRSSSSGGGGVERLHCPAAAPPTTHLGSQVAPSPQTPPHPPPEDFIARRTRLAFLDKLACEQVCTHPAATGEWGCSSCVAVGGGASAWPAWASWPASRPLATWPPLDGWLWQSCCLDGWLW